MSDIVDITWLRRATPDEKLTALFTHAHDIALEEVVRLARKTLKEEPCLDHFLMAMGVWCFWDRNGHHVQGYPEEFGDFISQWDDTFHLTGNPMRFTATGPLMTDWELEDMSVKKKQFIIHWYRPESQVRTACGIVFATSNLKPKTVASHKDLVTCQRCQHIMEKAHV